ncbi:hypothetical protein L1887_07014 [Cichorium endivia]|nr:hypothetical protein L1887_07014 [Cichorium endivia]
MELRPSEHPPDVIPPPVEVFIPSLSNRAKKDKTGNLASFKLNPKATVKKPGFASGRRSNPKKETSSPMEFHFGEDHVSSDSEMANNELNLVQGKPLPLAIVHPPKCIDAKGFIGPLDLTSPVSVLQKELILCSTSFSEVSIPSSCECEPGLSSGSSSGELNFPASPSTLSIAPEIPPVVLNDCEFPPLPRANGMCNEKAHLQIGNSKVLRKPSLLGIPSATIGIDPLNSLNVLKTSEATDSIVHSTAMNVDPPRAPS